MICIEYNPLTELAKISGMPEGAPSEVYNPQVCIRNPRYCSGIAGFEGSDKFYIAIGNGCSYIKHARLFKCIDFLKMFDIYDDICLRVVPRRMTIFKKGRVNVCDM